MEKEEIEGYIPGGKKDKYTEVDLRETEISDSPDRDNGRKDAHGGQVSNP